MLLCFSSVLTFFFWELSTFGVLVVVVFLGDSSFCWSLVLLAKLPFLLLLLRRAFFSLSASVSTSYLCVVATSGNLRSSFVIFNWCSFLPFGLDVFVVIVMSSGYAVRSSTMNCLVNRPFLSSRLSFIHWALHFSSRSVGFDCDLNFNSHWAVCVGSICVVVVFNEHLVVVCFSAILGWSIVGEFIVLCWVLGTLSRSFGSSYLAMVCYLLSRAVGLEFSCSCSVFCCALWLSVDSRS